MNVGIISPFKTGTTSLNTALFNAGIKTLKSHGFNDEISKTHPPNSFTHIFLLLRDPKSTYLSAYFQDIDIVDYSYYYGDREKVLNADPNELIEHFKSFNWNLFPHVNHDYFYECIEKYFNVNLKRIDEDEKFWISEKMGTFFIIIRTEKLNEVIDEVCFRVGLPKLVIEKHNNSQDKWYVKKYEEVKLLLK